MQDVVFDSNGKRISNPKLFYDLLRVEHQVTSKIEILDTTFDPIEGGTIFSADKSNDLSNFITDGNVDVDTTRGTRRTAQLTLLNPTAEFSPHLGNLEPDGPWVGKVYLNRAIRAYRGLYSGNQALYVPIGTFLVDVDAVVVERNMSQVNLTMSDLWKKLTKSFFTHKAHFNEGTPYNDIIRAFINEAGADEPLNPNIDSLSDRSHDDSHIGSKIHFAQGDSRGDKLLKLAGDWDIDMFFDPMGRFTTQDRRDARSKPPAWHLYSAQEKGSLISITRSFNDDNLYNHVIVIGTAHPKHVVRLERTDRDSNSKTSVDLIGDRVKIFTSNKIGTMEQAQRAMKRLWGLRLQLNEENDIECICNPGLEGDDVIQLTDLDYARVDNHFRLRAFNIPLVTSRQQLKLVNVVYGDEFL